MEENIKVGLRGHITIRANGKPIYSNNNSIEPDAAKILMRCLTQLDFPKSVDIVDFFDNMKQ